MKAQRLASATFIGQVSSVRGSEVLVRLRDVPTTLVMVDGASHRIGQIGNFVRIPLGYTQLFGVCTQVGADLLRPGTDNQHGSAMSDSELSGYRWMTIVLFGESVERKFERGVGQYPTVGDEVHLVTSDDMRTIYSGKQLSGSSISIGHIAGAPDIPAEIDLASLVTRHACVVGSTGSGKSNLMAVLLRGITSSPLLSARVLVIDPHGEYSSALLPGSFTKLSAQVGSVGGLRVPYWALGFEEMSRLSFGPMSESVSEYIRDKVRGLKLEAAALLDVPPPDETVSADSPIPFSLRRLWFELRRNEDVTFTDPSQTPSSESIALHAGDAERLLAAEFPAAAIGSGSPFLNKQRRGIARQLEFLRNRLLDPRFSFMFGSSDGYHASLEGRITNDLDGLIAAWIGHDNAVTVLDVSGLPPEVLDTVVGAMLTVIYEALFWGMNLDVGGKNQPLLVVLDEAHRFVPIGSGTTSSRICNRIAREGRKYGVGLMVVTQRPSDIDPTILSQCGSMIALRLTNAADRSAVSSTVPDDLGNLTALLPSLRTGECLILGEALQIPSRVRVSRAPNRPVGDDPQLPESWLLQRPTTAGYTEAIVGWRSQELAKRIEGQG
ncbi:ATP-binding protein [Subtercola frigoramans]|uniref:ATP-binding protein n=1 Tax=Subtercola frigoramans TaxID=120298 RepID=A0ABS2L7S9_9MICO|nr:ATP-binding protein [Subtercola frigoramans]MBM7473137.1 hypothetical protein [Subtercola frigoramans]